jgi:hypothetical protein
MAGGNAGRIFFQKNYGIMPLTNNDGWDSALPCPVVAKSSIGRRKRTAEKSPLPTFVPPCASRRAGTPQRGVPAHDGVFEPDNPRHFSVYVISVAEHFSSDRQLG